MTLDQQNVNNIHDKMNALRQGSGESHSLLTVALVALCGLGLFLIYRLLTRDSEGTPSGPETAPPADIMQLCRLEDSSSVFSLLASGKSLGLGVATDNGRAVRRAMVIDVGDGALTAMTADESFRPDEDPARLTIPNDDGSVTVFDVHVSRSQQWEGALEIRCAETVAQVLRTTGAVPVNCRATVVSSGEDSARLRLTDVTTDGAEFVADEYLEAGSTLQIVAQFHGQTNPIPLAVRLSWIDDIPGALHSGGLTFTENQADWQVALADYLFERTCFATEGEHHG